VSRRYVLKRLGQALPAVAGLLVLTFFLIHLAPGDPVIALGGEHGDAAYYALIRAKFGLDRPLLEQFAVYATRVLGGDLGTSFVHGRAVSRVIADRLPATLLLMSTALILSTIVGVSLGTMAARRAHRRADLVLTSVALAGQAVPPFWLAQLGILALAVGTGLLPVQGMTDARRSTAGLAHLADVARHLVLPSLVLACGELALTTRLVRAALMEALGTDYVRTARAKGLPERLVISRHAMRAALLPLVSYLGPATAGIVTGSLVIEQIFQLPGIGKYFINGALQRDYTLVMGVVILYASLVILLNLVADVLYGLLDPKVRYE